MRPVFAGQQAFGKAVLEALLKRGENVVGVYAAPEKEGQKADPLKEAAIAAKLPVFQPASYRKPEVWEEFKKLAPDLQVMAFVTLFVPEEFLNDSGLEAAWVACTLHGRDDELRRQDPARSASTRSGCSSSSPSSGWPPASLRTRRRRGAARDARLPAPRRHAAERARRGRSASRTSPATSSPGIVAGPHVLHLIDHATGRAAQPVNTLALALIALAGGAELKLDALKRGLQSLVVGDGRPERARPRRSSARVFFAARPFIAFTRELPPRARSSASRSSGASLAITRSPSAALGVLSQTRASGPLARFTLAFVMASDVVVVVLLAAAITVARPLIDPALDLLARTRSARSATRSSAASRSARRSASSSPPTCGSSGASSSSSSSRSASARPRSSATSTSTRSSRSWSPASSSRTCRSRATSSSTRSRRRAASSTSSSSRARARTSTCRSCGSSGPSRSSSRARASLVTFVVGAHREPPRERRARRPPLGLGAARLPGGLALGIAQIAAREFPAFGRASATSRSRPSR